MKNKENKNINEEPRKLNRLDDDQVDEVTGGLTFDTNGSIGIDIEVNANPFGGVERTKTYVIDEKVRENG